MSLLLGGGASAGLCSAVHFVNDNEIRAMLEKVGSVSVTLGVVDARHYGRVVSEYAVLPRRKLTLKLAHRARSDNDCFNLEFFP